jgi:hypothetical protein
MNILNWPMYLFGLVVCLLIALCVIIVYRVARRNKTIPQKSFSTRPQSLKRGCWIGAALGVIYAFIALLNGGGAHVPAIIFFPVVGPIMGIIGACVWWLLETPWLLITDSQYRERYRIDLVIAISLWITVLGLYAWVVSHR